MQIEERSLLKEKLLCKVTPRLKQNSGLLRQKQKSCKQSLQLFCIFLATTKGFGCNKILLFGFLAFAF